MTYFQPIIMAMLAAIGVWIAIQQMLIAKAKLRLDLFNKRMDVFNTARTFLLQIARKGEPNDDDINTYKAGIADSMFLFNDGICIYLTEILDHSAQLMKHKSDIGHASTEADRLLASDQICTHWNWLSAQLLALPEKFKPHIHVHPPTGVWPWKSK